MQYSPYGSIIEQSGFLPTDRLFTGQRLESIGLYDYRARFYDPLTANFLSPDSIVPQPGNPAAWNRYLYVRGNPVRYSDPSGHLVEDPNRCVSFCTHPFSQPPQPPPPPFDLRTYLPGWENREQVSESLSALVVVVDVGETGVSLVGIGVEVVCSVTACALADAVEPVIPPPFESIGLGIAAYNELRVDQIEYSLSAIGLLSTIGADIYGENSYIDTTTGDLVIGQDTLVGTTFLLANYQIGEAFLDTGINLVELIYDYNRFRGNIPAQTELRVNFTKSGYFDLRVRDP